MARPKSPSQSGRLKTDKADVEGNVDDSAVAVEAPKDDDLEQEINTSLHDVMDLMAAEVERLQTALELYRGSNHPDKEQLIRWHVRQIDRRQDRLSQLKQMILSTDGGNEH